MRLLSRSRSLLLAAAMCAVPFASLVSSTAEAAGPTELKKIAVVDIQRCLLETKQGQSGTKDLEKALSRSQAKLERAQRDLQKQVADLQAKAAMLSQEEGMCRQEELMRKEQELQQLIQDQQTKLAEKEAQLMDKVYRNVAKIVKTIAKEEGIQIVLVRSPMSVLYANPKIDLTNKVIVAYDKKYK
jgi:outer membrane protein